MATLPRRDEVLTRFHAELPGRNLYDLAGQFGITIDTTGGRNKGWVGQTLERVAGLAISSRAGRDGSDFELKSTTLVPKGPGWKPKETIKITQLNPQKALEEEFESSTLWEKLSRLILVGCHHVSPTECAVVTVRPFDLVDKAIVAEIKEFWREVRLTLCNGEMPDYFYTGSSEDYVQLRPVGDGKQTNVCPITGRHFPAQAFYGTKRLVSKILELGD